LSADLAQINSLDSDIAAIEFLKCCGSSVWARRLVDQRPFVDLDDLQSKAKRIWWSLAERDWLEAFHSHPKIGEKKASQPQTAEAARWSAEEQAGIHDEGGDTETDQIQTDLAELNQQYEEKFGYIFIVCATGKDAAEMLAHLRQRLQNKPDEELRIAAAEQAKITELRINKLLKQ
jgi:OHCU decarboxylase